MLMAYGLGVSIPWSVLLVVVPFVNIVSSLPISWMGLGVRENAYIFFLTPLFLSSEQAIAFGALWLLAVTVTSGIGGMLSVLSPVVTAPLAQKEVAADPQATKIHRVCNKEI